MRWISCFSLCAALACSAPSLPTLPQANDDTPGSLTWVSLTAAVGGAVVDPSSVVAGQALRLVLEVRSVANVPMAGVETVFSVQTDNFADLVRFPEGDRCLSDAQGQCAVVLVSRGGAGAFRLSARIVADPPVVESYPFVVLAKEDSARVQLDIETLGNLEWATGQGDPLAVADRVLALDVDQAVGRRLTVRLLDGFDNPLAGRSVRLSVVREAQPAPDAGPPVDSGSADTGVVGDTGAATDTGSPDATSAADAGAGDAGALDAALGDGPVGDGGRNKVLTAPLDRTPVEVTASERDCTPSDNEGEDELPSLEVSVATDEQGRAEFCVQPGTVADEWKVLVDPAGLFASPDGATAMALSGLTREGTPAGLVLVDPAEPAEGEPEPRVRCAAGEETDPARFRVVDATGGGVPGIRVVFEALGGLASVSPRAQDSDAQGLVTVQAICPSRMITGGRIQGRLPDYQTPPKSLAVEVQAGVIHRVEIAPFGEWPDPMRSGDELTVRVTAYDEDGNAVTRAGARPLPGEPDTRELLQFRFSMASVGHAEALRLVGSNEPLISEVVTADPELSAAEMTLRVTSRATYSNPIQLRAQPVGSELSDQVSINVAPGDPAHLVVSPAGVVEALLGGGAGELTYTVLDGDGDAANAVPNVPVQITAPQSLVLAANWTNAQTFTGTTGPDGRFRVSVLQANAVGAAVVTGTLQTEGGPVTAATTVQVGEGSAASLTMTLDGQALPLEEGLPTLTMRAGTALTQTLAIRVLNNQGAGLANRGLSIAFEQRDPTPEDDPSAFDPSFDQQNRVTDDTGTIRFGQGALALTAGGNTGTFVYRLAHGNTPAIARLRIVQIPGPPVIATLTAAEVRTLNNFGQSPNDWSDEAVSLEVTLRARDANNLAPAGLRMWLDVRNCFVSQQLFTLDEHGQATFRVVGGAELDRDCTLRPRYGRDSEELDNYTTSSVNGRASRDDDTAEQTAQLLTHLVIATGGFTAPVLSYVDRGNILEPNVNGGFNSSTNWNLYLSNTRKPNNLGNEVCHDAEQCTVAQIVRMQRNDQGEFETVLGQNGEVEVDGLLLDYTFGVGGAYTASVTLPGNQFAEGGLRGLRLKNPGENGAVSRAFPFYVRSPLRWADSATSRWHHVLPVAEGVGSTRILGGWRKQLYGDATPELLLCGTDDVGGWFAIVKPNDQGFEPPQAIRSWTRAGGNVDVDFPEPNLVCTVGYMDGDDHLDLIILAEPVNGNPRTIIHRGVPGETIFETTPHAIVWAENELRNRKIMGLSLLTNPASVVFYRAHDAAQNRRDNFARGRSFVAHRFRIIDVNNRFANGGYLEPVHWYESRHALMKDHRQLNLASGHTISTDGSLQNSSWRSSVQYGPYTNDEGSARVRGFDFDGRVVSVFMGHNASLWDPRTNQRTFLWQREPNGPIYNRRSALAGGREFLILASFSDGLRVINLRTLETVYTKGRNHLGLLENLVTAPDANIFVTVQHLNGQDVLNVWDVATGRLQNTINPPVGGDFGELVLNAEHTHALVRRVNNQSCSNYDLSTGQMVSDNPCGDQIRFPQEPRVARDAFGEYWYRQNKILRRCHETDNPCANRGRIQLIRNRYSNTGHNSFGNDETLAFSHGGDLIAVGKSRNDIVGGNIVGRRADVSIYMGQAVPPNTNQSEDFEFQYRISLPFSIPFSQNQELVRSLQFSPDDEKIRVILQGGYQLLLSKNPAGDYAAGSNNYDWHNPMLLAGQNESGFQSMVAGYRMTEISLRKPYTWRLNCGNGVVDEGELFDNGQPWEYQEYGASCGATCGDGQRDQGEQCDDGNDSNDDECATTCQRHRCGDGVVRADLQPGDFGFETCDDGNLNNDDACSSVCQAHRCGDGVVREDLQEGEVGFEVCDDGNQSNTDSCSISCRSAVCGDGLVNRTALINDPAFENCDDGNNIDGDGCTNCLLDNCGNGQVDVGEECDDGNNNHLDDCVMCLSSGSCTRIGFKRGDADWSCPAGQRLPGLGEWWRVARCVTQDDHAFLDRGMNERVGRHHGVGVSVGGCGCKWAANWCGQPSVETIREGRMCGDWDQLHICVSD